ncbi:MAG: hypothetical protein IKB70_08810 [Bacilli bacterium]|nr:hypothetical protein [Bacilli bacterium]
MANKRKVRIRNGFSDRNGIKPVSREMQIFDFEKGTRIVLFNRLKNLFDQQVEIRDLDIDCLIKFTVENAFNDVYQGEYEDTYTSLFVDVLDIFNNGEYHSILDIIEFVCNLIFEGEEEYSRRCASQYGYCFYVDVRASMNDCFEDEFVGYRFIGDKIVKITNNVEIESINNSSLTPYDKVNESISKAVAYISETGFKDYKNSIKEAISSVEQMANILLNTSGLTLSNAISQLADKNIVNNYLKSSIKNLYNYSSDTNGVRHGNNKDNDNISFEDAKFILITCSAIINYFCSIANKK